MQPANYWLDFTGGTVGEWKISRMNPVVGEGLTLTSHLQLTTGSITSSHDGVWTLKGFTSHARYADKAEKEKLLAVQATLGREDATCAALIPIRKNEVWWALAQDERRKIFEADSHHTSTGLKYLPAIARKLYHCRDIGQPFDFLTWFEYAPEHADVFEELVYILRQTEEWNYVDREVDIRLTKS